MSDNPESFSGDTTNKMPFHDDLAFRERERESRFEKWNITN